MTTLIGNYPPGTPAFELASKCAELSEMLLSKHPRMPVLLAEIHSTLRQQPENVTLATEEQIQTIVSGLKAVTQTEFAAATVKSSASATANKSLKNKIASLGLDAI